MYDPSGAGSGSTVDGSPNVVVVTCHDLGQHLGCYGVDTVQTPNLDRLAEEGVRFENGTASSPVCSPSRGSLLTGQYPQTNGLMGLTHSPWWWELDDGAPTMPELLSDAGYDTHLAGFQHVNEPDPHVGDAGVLGFDHQHSEDVVAEETVAAAADVFESAGEDPFYVQVGFHEVHRAERPIDREPYDEDGVFVPGHLVETPELRDDLAEYQALINKLDEHVGDLLASLETAGVRDETVVVFAADHGIPYPGAKWWCRSDGVEIALLMDGPGAAFETRDVVEPPMSNVDILPTLLDLVDVPVPTAIEGVSFAPFLTDPAAEPPREAAFTQFTSAGSEQRSLITADHTLIANFGAGREIEYPIEAPPTSRAGPNNGDPRPHCQLYDRRADPHELTNIANEQPEVRDEFVERLKSWMSSVEDDLLAGGVCYPYHRRTLSKMGKD
jgi:arylsulfatase A-like enzyme